MAQRVMVYKRKYDGHESRRFAAQVFESPREGWLATFSDTTTDECYKQGQPVGRVDYRYVIYLLSTTRMLTASFYFFESGELHSMQCDVALPATFVGDEIVFIDLELDLVADGAGNHYLRDFREFATNRERMAYPPEVVAGARKALLECLRLYRRREFPFDSTPQTLLRQCLQQ